MSEEHDEHVGAIRCPACGSNGPLRLISAVECWRAVYGVKHGHVEVDGLHNTECDDIGTNHRFECRAELEGGICGRRWPVPAWVVRRLVYYF